VIDSRPLVADRPDAVALPASATGLSFEDVCFGYSGSEPVLRGLSLDVSPGETVAVVGASGSGKSTIAQLVPRFYDPQRGSVRIGGHDIASVTRESLRAAIGLVGEDSFLFSDTVRANIAFGRPGATGEQVIAAARAAEAEEFITGLPDGYDTVIGEQGLTLSGGQRQRIALDRLLLAGPDGDAEPEPAAAAPPAATPASNDAGGGASSAISHWDLLSSVPPSPEMLARLAALPPATDTPRIDAAQARAPEPRFT